MTFIYKEKKGIKGKIYKRIIQTAIQSKYIDLVVVFSNAEKEYYASILNINPEKIISLPLGIENREQKRISKEKKIIDKIIKDLPDQFFLSVGRSNRDYDFLFECADKIELPIVVLSDSIKPQLLPHNIILYNDIRGEDYLDILDKSYAVIITLKNPNISSGQLVMLQAMKSKKPIIVTKTNFTEEYVKNNESAIVIEKNGEELINATKILLKDKKMYNMLIKNAYNSFITKYSLYSLGENIAKYIQFNF